MAIVLLAEDDTELQDIYARWLGDIDDVSLRTAADGREARDRVDESVDVAVLDRRMPKIAGDDVARIVQSSQPDCDVVVVSAFKPDDGIAADDYDRYLTKPIQRDQLVAAVEHELDGRA